MALLDVKSKLRCLKLRKAATMDPSKINDAFMAAWDEFGDDKSTEFLLSITADRLGIDYSDVVDGLAAIHDRK
jgi:hypothetical protein